MLVTGFGMLGHAREMALASEVTIELDHSRVAALPGALDAIRQGFMPGGLKNNRDGWGAPLLRPPYTTYWSATTP